MAQAAQIQGSNEWLAFRKKGIGSSDIAVIAGVSPWKDVHTLWMEKTGRQEEPLPTNAMMWGTEHEETARKAYIAKTGNVMMPQVFQENFCIASLDGINFEGLLILEIKCPKSKTTLELAKKGVVEKHYLYQVQWQMFVSGASKAHFWVWTEKESALVEIVEDKNLQAYLFSIASNFWEMVEKDIEPEVKKEEFLEIDSEAFIKKADLWKKTYSDLEEAKQLEKIAREALLEETDGGSCKGNGVKITLSESQSVDWKSICKANNLTDEITTKPFTKVSVGQKVSLIK